MNGREFLVAVLESADPAVTVRERLEAMKLLAEIGDPEPPCTCQIAAKFTDAEHDEFIDLALCDVVFALDGRFPGNDLPEEDFDAAAEYGDPLVRFPGATAAIRHYVEREAKKIAVEL